MNCASHLYSAKNWPWLKRIGMAKRWWMQCGEALSDCEHSSRSSCVRFVGHSVCAQTFHSHCQSHAKTSRPRFEPGQHVTPVIQTNSCICESERERDRAKFGGILSIDWQKYIIILDYSCPCKCWQMYITEKYALLVKNKNDNVGWLTGESLRKIPILTCDFMKTFIGYPV